MTHKRLIFIRHAHRDTEIHTRDNGLSERGHEQVKLLVKHARNREIEDALFLSSPKVRCIETISPVAEDCRSKIKIDERIGEGCSAAAMESFVDWWKYEAPDLVVACSHGDVIPMLVQKLSGAAISIKKAGWCELELVGREVYLTWLVQKYD